MNISTLLRLVVPAAEGEENETAAKPAAGRSEPARSSAVPEAGSTASPAVPVQARHKPAARSAPPPAPPEPKADGTYQYGVHRQPLEQRVSASLETVRELPSLKALEARYPHVLGKIRAVWGNHRAFDLLMRELLLPSRQGRIGFDPEAALELTRLQEYYTLVVARADDSPAPNRSGR